MAADRQNTNKHVRLTQDKPSQKGWLWSRMPLSVLNWQVEFEFKVDGSAHNLYGDGFAVWVSKDRGKVGPVFGSVGELYLVTLYRDYNELMVRLLQWTRYLFRYVGHTLSWSAFAR